MLHKAGLTAHPQHNEREKHSVFYLKSNVLSSNNSTIFKVTDLFILYFFIRNVYENKRVFKIKGYKIM